MKARNILIYLSMLYKGDFNQIYSALVNHENPPSDDEVNEMMKQVTSPCITILDEDYPDYLKQKVFQPPFVLYYRGDISLIKDEEKNIAVIGSRKCTNYGWTMTANIVSEICEHFNIVSGLAKGIDSCAHSTCINKLGKTIAVLGCGIDYCYPQRNQRLYEQIKKNGLLISEYPGKTPPQNKYFPIRNRLIVGLSKIVVITEASKHSGTSISTAFALQSGKDVCCVPYPADSNSLCNHLIQQGAYMIENAKDLYDILDYREYEPLFNL